MFTFHDEISKLKDIIHMNGYPKQIFHNHVKKYLSVKLMTTDIFQKMNDEKKYIVIMPFIGHPSMVFKKSLTKNVKNNYKKCTIFKTFNVQNSSSLKDETPLVLWANAFIFLKVLVIRTKPILVKQKYIWQLGLGSIFLEIQPFFNIYLPAAHATILPLKMFIFCHMVKMILIIK